jgi:hypothetical protein
LKRNLGKYLHTAPSADRIERNWRRIALGLRPAPRSLSRTLLAAAAVIALVAVVVLARTPRPASIEGTVLETEGQSETVGLPDGSRIVLGPSSRLLLVNVSRQRVRLELERGTIDVAATHLAGRTFSVGARVLDIDVVGTRFRVEVGPPPSDVQVSVREGRVRVTSRNDAEHPRYLGAGEVWSSHPSPAQSVSAPAVAVQAVPDAGKPHDAPAKPRLPTRFAELYREGRYVDAYTLVADDFTARSHDLGADELFTLAETARLSGHPRDAATAFDALRTRFRANPRAPLAALELGRLDLDELDQPSAAKEALEDAIQLQPDGFFREDADARRIQALEEMGLRAECAAARAQYLDAYPQGSHRTSVARRCH